MHYHGKKKRLTALLRAAGITGSWHKEPNGVRMYRGGERANLHWSKTKGTIWIDGPADAQQRLRQRLYDLLRPTNHQQSEASSDAKLSSGAPSRNVPACLPRKLS